NPGTPDVIREINEALRMATATDAGPGSPISEDGQSGSPYHMNQVSGTAHVSVDTEKLAESALVDGVNACRIFTKTFGRIPAKDIAVTQQAQWSFGQSWPSLIFMPYMAFLDGGV